MKIPKSIIIGGVDYSISEYSASEYITNNMGKYIQGEAKILLRSELPEDLFRKTFIHEVLHAIMAEYAILDDGSNEEILVDRLTTGVMEVIEQLVN